MPAGRPPELDQVVHTRADGTQVTAAQQVIERRRLGLTYEEAADTATISRQTLHNWRTQGARARAKQTKGEKLTANEARYAQFLDDLESADAQAHLERLAVIQRATQPFTVTKIVERHAVGEDGQTRLLERTTTTEQKPGQWTAAAWWLERRMPQRYARRVELSGPEGGPIPVEDRANALADSLRAYQQGVDDARADQEATV